MVEGRNFHGLESSDDFIGLYFCGIATYSNFNSYVANLWIRRLHEIHENLNPTKLPTMW